MPKKPEPPHWSSQRVVLSWRGDRWEVYSRDDTSMNQRRLAPGETVQVSRGAHITFGDLAHAFAVAEDTPPRALARAGDGELVQADDEGFLALPGSVSISSHDGQWFLDNDEERRVHDGDVLQADGKSWRLELPMVVEETWQSDQGTHARLDAVGLRFTVSADGKLVELDVLHGAAVTRLESRAHHRLLLALARQRLADEACAESERLPAADRGWMSTKALLDLLGAGASSLNLDIHRARRQLGDEVGMRDARLLIERRRGAMIRIGLTRLEVVS